MYCIYIHCVMIWSGQLHYSIESMRNFTTVANISILCEGGCAILLHLYVIYMDRDLVQISSTSQSAIPMKSLGSRGRSMGGEGEGVVATDLGLEDEEDAQETSQLLRRRSR